MSDFAGNPPEGSRFVFDELTGLIEDEVYAGRLDRWYGEESTRLSEPLRAAAGARPSRPKAIALLDEAIAIGDARVAEICDGVSFDLLLAVVRRCPVSSFSPNWVPTLMMLLVGHGRPTPDVGLVMGDGLTALIAPEADLVAAIEAGLRVAVIAQLTSALVDARRLVGKGSLLRPTEGAPLATETDPDLRLAMDDYDARRSAQYRVLADQGLFVPAADPGGDAIMWMARTRAPVYVSVPERDIRLKMDLVPATHPALPLARALEAYRDPIEHDHGIQVEQILHVLVALHRLVERSMRRFAGDKGYLELVTTGSAEADAARLDFTYHLFQSGYFRRSEEEWLSAFASVDTRWAQDEAERRAAGSAFLRAFCVDGDRDHLDVTTLRPFPLVTRAPEGAFVIDLVAIPDWVGALIEGAQQSYESAHGDRFHLALVTELEAVVPVEHIHSHWRFTDTAGRTRKGDVLIETDGAILCVECKALRKDGRWFRGDPAVVQQRRGRLRKAQAQIEEAADAVRAGRGHDIEVAGRRVHALVCTPSPEFIHPLGAYGEVDGIPAVCSSFELLDFVGRLLRGAPA